MRSDFSLNNLLHSVVYDILERKTSFDLSLFQNGKTRGGTFHGEMDRCRENQGWTTACSELECPNVTRRTKKRIAQSKRARAGSLALVD